VTEARARTLPASRSALRHGRVGNSAGDTLTRRAGRRPEQTPYDGLRPAGRWLGHLSHAFRAVGEYRARFRCTAPDGADSTAPRGTGRSPLHGVIDSSTIPDTEVRTDPSRAFSRLLALCTVLDVPYTFRSVRWNFQ
jgi:hypothetical protein